MPENILVRDVMTRNLVIVHVDHTIEEAAIRMRDKEVGWLPACDGDEAVGMVTDRDIAVRAVAEGREPSTPVHEIMTSHIIYCHEDEDIAATANLMRKELVRRVAVADRTRTCVGVVALRDLSLALGNEPLLMDTLAELSRPSVAAKKPHHEKRESGRARKSRPGRLHVYHEAPFIPEQSRPGPPKNEGPRASGNAGRSRR